MEYARPYKIDINKIYNWLKNDMPFILRLPSGNWHFVNVRAVIKSGGKYYLQIHDTIEFAPDFWNYKWVDWDRIKTMGSYEDKALIEQVNLSKEYKNENN
ncbi:MAG: hypothetical protein SVR08_16220 [Spirochaetota bacterium]|nr:hypothetical protein [Spirochaetota bacterium]